MGFQKIKKKKKIAGNDVTRVIGVETKVEVFKSSVWKPYRTAPVTIIFDYGIDDVRTNLQFVKENSKGSLYSVGGQSLGKSLDDAVMAIEAGGLEKRLQKEVVGLWEEIEEEFVQERKPKRG
jgi:hypothetical protein